MSSSTFRPGEAVRWRQLHPPHSQVTQTGLVVEHQLARALVVIATHGTENRCFEVPAHRVERCP